VSSRAMTCSGASQKGGVPTIGTNRPPKYDRFATHILGSPAVKKDRKGECKAPEQMLEEAYQTLDILEKVLNRSSDKNMSYAVDLVLKLRHELTQVFSTPQPVSAHRRPRRSR
jgi:hypothetical protein